MLFCVLCIYVQQTDDSPTEFLTMSRPLHQHLADSTAENSTWSPLHQRDPSPEALTALSSPFQQLNNPPAENSTLLPLHQHDPPRIEAYAISGTI